MKIVLDLNPVEASIIEDALKLYRNQVESLWSGGVLRHFIEQKEKYMEINYPHLLEKYIDGYRRYKLDAEQSGATNTYNIQQWIEFKQKQECTN